MRNSFQTGFNDAFMVLVFFLTLSVSGMSFNLTYGSLKPFGSIGIRFRPSLTAARDDNDPGACDKNRIWKEREADKETSVQ